MKTKYFFLGWLVALVASLIFLPLAFSEILNSEGAQGAVRIFSSLVHPDWSLLPQAFASFYETLAMAIIGTSLLLPLTILISFPLGFSFSSSSAGRGVKASIKMLLGFSRSIETLIWAILFTVWVGIGPLAGVLALALHTFVSLTKVLTEIIEEVDRNTVKNFAGLQYSRLALYRFALWPQVRNPFLSQLFYRLDINIRMGTLIGLVGGGGIGTYILQFQGQAQWSQVGVFIFVIALNIFLLDIFSKWIRNQLRG